MGSSSAKSDLELDSYHNRSDQCDKMWYIFRRRLLFSSSFPSWKRRQCRTRGFHTFNHLSLTLVPIRQLVFQPQRSVQILSKTLLSVPPMFYPTGKVKVRSQDIHIQLDSTYCQVRSVVEWIITETRSELCFQTLHDNQVSLTARTTDTSDCFDLKSPRRLDHDIPISVTNADSPYLSHDLNLEAFFTSDNAIDINFSPMKDFNEKFDFECFSETDLAPVHYHEQIESTEFYSQPTFSPHVKSNPVFTETNDANYQLLATDEVENSQISAIHSLAVATEPIFTAAENGISLDSGPQERIITSKSLDNLPRWSAHSIAGSNGSQSDHEHTSKSFRIDIRAKELRSKTPGYMEILWDPICVPIEALTKSWLLKHVSRASSELNYCASLESNVSSPQSEASPVVKSDFPTRYPVAKTTLGKKSQRRRRRLKFSRVGHAKRAWTCSSYLYDLLSQALRSFDLNFECVGSPTLVISSSKPFHKLLYYLPTSTNQNKSLVIIASP